MPFRFVCCLRSFRFLPLCSVLWSASLVSTPARADEFATIAPGNAIYGALAGVGKAGWLGTSSSASGTLTRYEAALQTARAIFAVSARARADADWARNAPRPALRSLRELIAALNPELKQLDIDTVSTLSLIDSLLKPRRAPVAPRLPDTRPAIFFTNRNSLGSSLGSSFGGSALGASSLLPSNRLRIGATVQALAREADDPFRQSALWGRSSLTQRPDRLSLTGEAAFDVSRALTLRTGFERNRQVDGAPAPGAMSGLRDQVLNGPNEGGSVRGGVDLNVAGVRFSGDVARLSALDPTLDGGLRIAGGVRLSAWQNRLALSANLSRLVPEDSLALTSTATQLNLDFGVTERLRLNLLYQSLFSAPSPTRPNSFLGGGISVNF